MKDFGRFKLNAIAPKRVAVAGAAAMLAYTLIAGMTGTGRASASITPTEKALYAVKLVSFKQGDIIELQAEVTDNDKQTVIASQKLHFRPGDDAEAISGNTKDNVETRVRVLKGGNATRFEVEVIVEKAGTPVFRRTLDVSPGAAPPPAQQWSGQTINLSLKDAEIRDVLNTFGKLTGIQMDIDPAVSGTISIQYVDVPWDKALHELVQENNLTYTIEGHTMHVKKR